MTLSVVAPAFDEEAVIGRFVPTVLAALPPDAELLIVDDGSTDATPQILSDHAANDSRLRVVTHETNRGMGAALATGFLEARGDVIVTMDADLSHPLHMLSALVSATTSADVVLASRYIRGGGMVGIPLARVAISRFANVALRILFWTDVHDLTTGFRAYRATALRDLRLIGTGFETQLELSVRLVARGVRIVEVPLILNNREAGESKMRYFKLARRYGAMVVRLLAVRWLGR